MEGPGEVLHVVVGDARDGDAAIRGAVDVVFLAKAVHLTTAIRKRWEGGGGASLSAHLLAGQAGEAEHPNLVRDVVPRAGGAEVLEVLAEAGSHGDDSEAVNE